jgi:hypothetical protein
MNSNYLRGENGARQSGIVGYDPVVSQTDRPTTPQYLLQQSSEEQYQRALSENLTGYLTSAQNHSENDLTGFLLPKDVHYYYGEREKVFDKVEAVFGREKQAIEGMFDDFLKQVLLICEDKKNQAFELLSLDQRSFTIFYEGFRNDVRSFLQDANHKLNNNMNSFNSMANDMKDDYMNPLEFQMHKFKMQRKQMDHSVSIIQEMIQTYNRSSIPEHKKKIENLIIEPKERDSQAPNRRTSIDSFILDSNLKVLADILATRMKGFSFQEQEVKGRPDPLPTNRIMSPKVWDRSHFNQLGRDLEQRKQNNQPVAITSSPVINVGSSGNQASPQQRPSSQDLGSKAFLNLNLETAQVKKERKNVQFSLPTIEEEVRVNDPNQMKSSNISININNRPFNNNNYINIYSEKHEQVQQNLVNGRFDLHSKGLAPREKSFDPSSINSAGNSQTSFRPSSVNLKTSNFYGLSQPQVQRPNSSINDLDQRSQQQPVLSISKTNLLSKANSMSRRYKTNLLLNDYNSRINCFEIEPHKNLIFYGTNEGEIQSSRINFDKGALYGDKSLALGGSILFIHQIKPNLLLVATDSIGQNLFVIDIDSFKIQLQFKTYKERIKLVAFYDSSTFIIVTGDDKLLMYDADSPAPKKSFKIPTARLVDVCMPSSKLLFTGAENGDIRIIKINQESGALAIEVS